MGIGVDVLLRRIPTCLVYGERPPWRLCGGDHELQRQRAVSLHREEVVSGDLVLVHGDHRRQVKYIWITAIIALQCWSWYHEIYTIYYSLYLTCGVTRLEKIRNEKIRGTTQVGEISKSKKGQERRMRWYGHVMRRDEEYVGKMAMGIEVQGSRRRGRPKKRWVDCVKDDL